MNMKSRLKLFFGVTVLTVVCAGLVVYMDYSRSMLGSTSAVLKASNVSVGTDYAGTVTEQFVQVGDRVEPGQKLFYVKSSTLVQALNSNQLQQKDLLASLTPDNQLIITANGAGFVSGIDYGKGSYVPNASKIATITTDTVLTVTAKFKMTPTQYAKTTSKTPLSLALPDGTKTVARINNISIDTQANPLLVTITASANGLSDQAVKAGQAGTPVIANLTLQQDTYWSKIAAWRP
jgi:multidrug efflux pump subunit AcrA (membrane-fusion protein)